MQCWWRNLLCSGTIAVNDIGESSHISKYWGLLFVDLSLMMISLLNWH